MHVEDYNVLADVYKNESKEDLIKRIAALTSLELSDRSFANQCVSGTSILNVTSLFDYIEEVHGVNNDPTINMIYELMDTARTSFRFIKSGLADMNDNSRCSKALKQLDENTANVDDYLSLADLNSILNKLSREDAVLSMFNAVTNTSLMSVAIFYLESVGECRNLKSLFYPDLNGGCLNMDYHDDKLCYYTTIGKIRRFELTDEVLSKYKLTPAGKEFVRRYL